MKTCDVASNGQVYSGSRVKPPRLSKDHDVRAAVDRLGGRLYYRAKAWWMSVGNGTELQLTYEYEDVNGERRAITDHKAVALKMLSRMEQARAEWKPLRDRVMDIITGVRDEVVPNFRYMHFCSYQHPSGDIGTVSMFVKANLYIEPVGVDRVTFEGRDFEDVIAQAIAYATKITETQHALPLGTP